MKKQFLLKQIPPLLFKLLGDCVGTFNSSRLGNNAKHTLWMQSWYFTRSEDGKSILLTLTWKRRKYILMVVDTSTGRHLKGIKLYSTTNHKHMLSKVVKYAIRLSAPSTSLN